MKNIIEIINRISDKIFEIRHGMPKKVYEMLECVEIIKRLPEKDTKILQKIILEDFTKRYDNDVLKILNDPIYTSHEANCSEISDVEGARYLKKQLESEINDHNILEFYLKDFDIIECGIALKELKIKLDKETGNYKLHNLNIELPILQGIIETYKTLMDKKLKHAYKSNLLDALKFPDIEESKISKEKPSSVLRGIVKQIRLYNKIIKGEISTKEPFVQLEDIINYAINAPNVPGAYKDKIINFKKDLAYSKATAE